MTQELLRLEEPMVSVDFLGDELIGRKKQTILKYLSLDDAIEQIGTQRFSKNTVDNVLLQPVRGWISENWDDDFIYDLSQRNLPISFRTSLAIGLFTTKIIDHLTDMGAVEVYASKDIQNIFENNELPVPQGLTKIDYASLPADVKRELVIPIVGNLYKAKSVAMANLLFQEGIKKQAVEFYDPGLLFKLTDIKEESDIVYFDKIKNLDMQANAAAACIKHYFDIKSSKRPAKEEQEDPEDIEKSLKELEERQEGLTEILQVPKVEFDEGTTLYDIFPFMKEETHEDLQRAFKRIAFYGTAYISKADEFDRTYLTLAKDGKLRIKYEFDSYSSSPEFVEADAISGKLYPENPNNLYDEYRSKAVFELIMDIREEIDETYIAIQGAKARYNKTTFAVEKGLMKVLTSKIFEEEPETDEDKRLAREAKATAGIYEGLSELDQNENQLTVYSNKPVDEMTLELDYNILGVIDRDCNFDISDLFSVHRDNLGDWFSTADSLLSTFRSVLVGSSEAFSILDIPPTNNPDEVKKAYRAIAVQLHPDKTPHLPYEAQLKATGKFMKASEAYETIMLRIGAHDVDSLSPTFYLGRISRLFENK